MLITRTSAIAAAAATALALTSLTTPASAGPRGNAAAIAAFAGIAGTIAVLAARSHYDDGPYDAAPAYGPYYGGLVHVAPRWGHWYHHRHWHR